MNQPGQQSLESGRAGTTQFKQLDDGRWVCFLAFDKRRARLLPSEEMGMQILRDSKRSTTVAVVLMVLASFLTQGAIGFEGAYEFPDYDLAPVPWVLMVGLVAYYGTSFLGALWLRRRYHALPITDRTAAMEETFDSRFEVVTWITFAAMLVSSFGAGYFFAVNDVLPLYILLPVGGSTGVCAANLHRLLFSARY